MKTIVCSQLTLKSTVRGEAIGQMSAPSSRRDCEYEISSPLRSGAISVWSRPFQTAVTPACGFVASAICLISSSGVSPVKFGMNSTRPWPAFPIVAARASNSFCSAKRVGTKRPFRSTSKNEVEIP